MAPIDDVAPSPFAADANGEAVSSTVPVAPPSLPLPIFRLSQARAKYLLYDIDTVTWLRQTHHILGVFIGGMPQFPQQNVFFGLPLELMPEEARLLVEKGLAFIVDDLEAHQGLIHALKAREPAAVANLQNQRDEIDRIAAKSMSEAARAKQEEQERGKEKRRAAEAKKGTKLESKSRVVERLDADSDSSFNAARLPLFNSEDSDNATPSCQHSSHLFESSPLGASAPSKQKQNPEHTWAVTPTTTASLLYPSSLPKSPNQTVPEAPQNRFDLFRHLHERGYFMSPGLRFGCEFSTYPGDPLRFHSHFLATSAEWDEEMDLLDIVGGGRLGTGVKKGYLLGGMQTDGERQGEVRTFCLEWGGM